MYQKSNIKTKKAPMFEKRTVVELSENEMTTVDGGFSFDLSWLWRRMTLN